MNLWVRRLVLAVVSLVLGFGLTVVIVQLVLGTTVPEYMWGPEHPPLPYFFLTGVFTAFFFALILDKFLATELLGKEK
ncbi:MAG: hypothetical protein KA314_20515 [Chloroflexi bacterium]|nr:hypothetical protein [Chloroflexota bacterium]MBP8058222.1 hypothetical protein [Chloroflexota bacterium]